MSAAILIAFMSAQKHTFKKTGKTKYVLTVLSCLPALAAGEQLNDNAGSIFLSIVIAIIVGMIFLSGAALALTVGRSTGSQDHRARHFVSVDTQTEPRAARHFVSVGTQIEPRAEEFLHNVGCRTRTVQTQSQCTYSSTRGINKPRFEVTRFEGATVNDG